MSPETVLVVEDDARLRHFVEVHLRLAGMAVRSAADGESALICATTDPPDLVLLDVALRGRDGFAVCRHLRADPRTAHVPIIFVTSRSTPADKIAGFTAGANDYVIKPFDPTELVARVRTTLARARELRSSSPLTGLPGNHRIDEEVRARLRRGQPLALGYVDLNSFKAFNDRYGYLRGDAVLLLAAEVALDALHAHAADGFLGHVGGDDFVLLCSPHEAPAVCDALIDAFDRRVLEHYDDVDRLRGFIEVRDRQGNLRRFPPVGVAVGLVTTERRPGVDHRELVAIAVEMKRYVKARAEGSAWALDDRTPAITTSV